ncbi:hypothetical protein BXG10_24355, partial [Salmonella enterica subsp. enterica serovar Enteritidis]|nr:hypothetical protein [Salmonella enterica subsp. enterica serovar Enteritidis]
NSSINNNDFYMKNLFHLAFDYIDEIKYASSNAFFADWGASAQGVNIVINNGNNNTHLLVNGGGNVIDAGSTYGDARKVALVSYSENTTAGITYDAITSDKVRFSDSRKEDILRHFTQLQGSNNDDNIALKSGLLLISSNGNDTLTGNGATYQLSDQHVRTEAHFDTNTIAKMDSNSNLLGIDTLINEGFDTFALSKNSIYANVYAGNQRNMGFLLNNGTVNFYSSYKNNSINTGNTQLTLHYEKLSDGVRVNMVGGAQSSVSKANGSIDTFTKVNQLIGTDNGDTYSFSGGNINSGSEYRITSGKGIDSYAFNGSTTKVTITAQKNSSDDIGEQFNFTGTNQNIYITSSNRR